MDQVEGSLGDDECSHAARIRYMYNKRVKIRILNIVNITNTVQM